MKLTISKEEFFKKLQDIQGATENKESSPILSHFLLTAKKQGSAIQATNLGTYLREPLEAVVEKEGKMCLPAKKMLEIVREVEGEITLESDDAEQWIRVIVGGSRFRVAGLPPKDFPAWPTLEAGVKVEIGTKMLLEMIQKSFFAAGDDDKRYMLNGVLFHLMPDEDNITFAATNGHRLAVVERKPVMDKVRAEVKAIMPKKSIAELKKFLVGDTVVNCLIGPEHVIFTIGPVDFMIRLLSGVYPTYRAIVPVHAHHAVFDRTACVQAVKRASLMSSNDNHVVNLALTKDKAAVTSAVQDVGEAMDEIPVDFSGENIALNLNSKYLLDAMAVLTGDKLTFELGQALEPVVIRDNADQQCFYIVMPHRV